MTFTEFYQELVDSNPSKTLKEIVLSKISEEIEINYDKKCYMFSITEGKTLLSHKYTYAKTAIEELNKGNSVVLISKLEPLKRIIVNQIKATIPKAKLSKYTDEYWLISV